MADFPNSIYEERETENLPGITFDAGNKKNLYSEDFQNHAAEIIAIEETLGENPQGVYATVKAWLEALAAGGSSVWGAITGTLSDQTDLQDALDAKQNSLGFTPENVANKATDLTSPDNTKYPTTQAVSNAIATAVSGLLDYRGSFDASSNLFPATGGSGIAGAILKGDFWMCSVAGTLGGSAVSPGDLIIALVDTPGTTAGNWDIVSHDLTYVPENVSNKSTSVSTDQASNTKYPSVKSVYDWATGLFQTALGFTAEDVANKSTNVTTDGASDTKYPSVKAVKTYVDSNGGEWTYLSKVTFTDAHPETLSFTSLSAHDNWKMVVRIANNSSAGSHRLTMLFTVNSVTSGYGYTTVGGTAVATQTSQASIVMASAWVDAFTSLRGEILMDGKHTNGVKCFEMGNMSWAGGSLDLGIPIRGQLLSNSANVSRIDITTNWANGTIELWYKDAK